MNFAIAVPTRRTCGVRLNRRMPACLLLCVALVFFPGIATAEIPIIDAHSQVDFSGDMERIIRLMDKAGIATTILAARQNVKPEHVLAFAGRNPGRIVPAVRSKSQHYNNNSDKFYKFFDKQVRQEGFRAIAEVLMYHAEKINKKGKSLAPKVVVFPDDKRVRTALGVALAKGWPFIVHIEFAAAGSARAVFMEKLEAMLKANSAHPFALIHMGQLDAGEAGRLIETHSNLHFLTSHATRISIKKSNEPWVDMFRGSKLAPEWKALVTRHPTRFVMAFDNVWNKHWGKFYLKQVKLWRKALRDLPPDVANALAYGNAERLWRLPPAN